jgi:DNA replication protein DnaC
LSACPEGLCDGSGFLYDEARRTARPCRCRPARIARRKAAAVQGRIPRRFHGVGFDREPVLSLERSNPHTVREVRRYVDAVSDRLAEGRGLWFRGDVGTGKTTLAMLISRRAMEAGHTVAIYSLPRLLALLRDTYSDDSDTTLLALVDRLCAVDLLHLDDVGAEQSSEWVLEQLYTIVNGRYEEGRAIVLTTNLDDAELEGQIGARTVSRLNEICGVALPVYGEDRRKDAHIRYPEVPEAPPRWEPAASAAWDEPEPVPYGRPPRRGTVD